MPASYIVARLRADGMPEPVIVSLSFDAGQAYSEGDETVHNVALPAELYRAAEAHVLAHLRAGEEENAQADGLEGAGPWRRYSPRRRLYGAMVAACSPAARQSVPTDSFPITMRRQRKADCRPPPCPTVTEPERALTDADMPPPETQGPDTDKNGISSQNVSATPRRQALARMLGSPAFNIVDGLDDYAEDFTQFGDFLGDAVTADMRSSHRAATAARRRS